MSTYIKIQNTWTPINRVFKKINGEWVLQNNILSALGDMIYTYGGHTISKLLYIIFNQQQYTGKSFLLTSTYDGNTVYPSWTILSGSQYVTINSNGKVTINEGVTNQTVEFQASYNGETDNKTITVSYDNQLTIESADTITGTSGNVIVRYNSNVITPTSLSITSGNQYATIDSSGNITILASGTITVSATYISYTATKNITLVYDSSTSTEVEVNKDGSMTTTVTIVTENQDGTTTETSVITTTAEDGSTFNTESETIINQDGSSETTSTTTGSDGSVSETTSTTSAPDPNTGTTTTQASTTTNNADGSSSQSTATIVTSQDGSSVSSSNTNNYDENGDLTGSSTNITTNNANGSSSSTTTNFDENGDPTDKLNEDTDVNGNEKTQNIEYNENGDEVVVGYSVDTSNNSNTGSLDFSGSANDSINTNFQPFNFNLTSEGFDMVIYFRAVYSEQPRGEVSNEWTFLDMTPDDKDNSWRYNQGLVLRFLTSATNKLSWQLRTSNNGKHNGTVDPITYNSISDCYKIGLRYFDNKLVIRNLLNNTDIFTTTKSPMFEANPSKPDRLKNTNVTIGSAWDSTNNKQFRYSNMDLYEFNLTKIDHWFDYA